MNRMKLENLEVAAISTTHASWDAVGIPTSSDNAHEAAFHANVKRFKEKKMNTKELKAAAWADYKKIIATCREVTDTAWADYIKIAAELKDK